MVTLTVKLPKLHSGQALVKAHTARYQVVDCARRWGKSTLAIDILADNSLNGESWSYFAPTYKMLADVWKELKVTLKQVIKYKNETEKRLELLTGGVIDCWSLDNADSVRGRKYHGVIVDEAAQVANLLDAWQYVLTPLLTDYSGRAYFLSTPKGHNGFWQLWQRGNDPAYTDWQSWQFPTSANPHIKQSEIESQRLELPERAFKQEYLADFIADSGGVFRGVQDVSILRPSQPMPMHEYVFGIDWAKSNDFTVVSVLDRTTKQQVHIERFNQVSWEVQRGRIMALNQQWKPSMIIAESNSIGEPNIEALQRLGLPVRPFQTTATSKTPLIDALVLAIETRAILLLNDPVQIGELSAYEMTRSASGQYKYNSPDGGHDDCVIALALAWHGVNMPARLLLWDI